VVAIVSRHFYQIRELLSYRKRCKNGKEQSHLLHMALGFMNVGVGRVKVAPPEYILGQHYDCWSRGEIF
jgi:hypothetical protein